MTKSQSVKKLDDFRAKMAMKGLLPESENIEDSYPVFDKFTVAGVFKNRFGDLSDPYDNNRYVLLSDEDHPCTHLYLRFKPGTDITEAIHEIESICAEYVDIYSPEMISQIGNRWLDASGNIRIYMILVFMAAAAGWLTSTLISDSVGTFMWIRIRLWHSAIVLFFMAFVMTLSTFWKVRRIMRTNPADVIKSE